MLAATSLRSLTRRTPAASLHLVQRYAMTTQAEAWTPATAKAIEAAGGASSVVDLKHVLPHIEARWAKMSKEEQYGVFRQLEDVQRKDWNELSIDEKKAAYFVSFGPHGPRKPITEPGQGLITLAGVTGLVIATFGLFFGLRQFAANKPLKTMTTEWQEAANERAREEKINPISGISSEGYKGKGFVQKSYV